MLMDWCRPATPIHHGAARGRGAKKVASGVDDPAGKPLTGRAPQRALAHDAAEAVERQVGHRRRDRADAVGDEAEREAEVRVGPAAGAAVAVMPEGHGRRAGPEGVVVAEPPAHAHAEDEVAFADLDSAE